MLLAAELALLAIDPASGRARAWATGTSSNACLAGLLVGDLVLGGHAAPGERDGTVLLTDDPPADPVLVATAQVVAVRGPKLKAVMSSMDRSLGKRLGTGTWDSVVATLVAGRVLGPAEGSVRPRHAVLDPACHDEVRDRVRHAAATRAIDAHALVLAMTGRRAAPRPMGRSTPAPRSCWR